MMKSASRSPEAQGYRSTTEWESVVLPGVRYEIVRPSLARRAELTCSLYPIAQRLERELAGQSVSDQCAAAVSLSEIDLELLKWGLKSLEGLSIDGTAATPALLREAGPEELCREITARIRMECGLTGEERKN